MHVRASIHEFEQKMSAMERALLESVRNNPFNKNVCPELCVLLRLLMSHSAFLCCNNFPLNLMVHYFESTRTLTNIHNQ
jgi:hypothetical protein